MTYVGPATVARVLDAVRSNEGVSSPVLASRMGNITLGAVQKSLTILRESDDVDHVSRFVPVVGFSAWHMLDSSSRDLFAWAIDTDGSIYVEAGPALRRSNEWVYERAKRLRRAGAVEPSKLVWSWDEATRRRSLAWDSLTAWERGVRVAA